MSRRLLSTGEVVGRHRSWATLKFKLSLRLLAMHLGTKFHHPMSSRSEVFVLTDKRTKLQYILLKTSSSLRYATPAED